MAELSAGRIRTRLDVIDLLRGLAIVAMVAFHVLWDLSYFGLIDWGVGSAPIWIGIQRAILSAFLLLAGMSLVLGHGEGVRWRAFWRRMALLVGAALLVTAGTWWEFPEYFAFFGVLHAIALFSLLALPLLRAPLWVVLTVAALALLLPLGLSSNLFNVRWLAWIGFFTTSPPTADIVPVFPWFGVMALGMALMLVLPRARLAGFEARGAMRALTLTGRWSLVLYLIHQPLLMGVITPLSAWLKPPEITRDIGFTQSCTASCAGAGDAAYCTAYCACALEQTKAGDLWGAIEANPRTPDEDAAVMAMRKLCTAMAE